MPVMPGAGRSQDVLAIEQHLSGGGLFEPGEAAGDGGLAAAGLADQGDDLAFPDREVHAVDGADRGPGEDAAAVEVLDQTLTESGGSSWVVLPLGCRCRPC